MVVVAPRAVLILGIRGFGCRIQKRLYIETTHVCDGAAFEI